MTPKSRDALLASLLDLHGDCRTLLRMRMARAQHRRLNLGGAPDRSDPDEPAMPLERVLGSTLSAVTSADQRLRARGLALSRSAPLRVRMHGQLCEVDAAAELISLRLQLQQSTGLVPEKFSP